jgi:response regulator RpfG family c-di-GMP phosphodiesterase
MIVTVPLPHSGKARALVVEDHSYFGNEIVSFLKEDCAFDVVYAANYLDAVKALQTTEFDFSFLDILLQNGKTGVDIAENFRKKLGKIMFITGCVDDTVLSRIKDYASASKLCEIWPLLEKFVAGGCPKIRVKFSDDAEAPKLSFAK